MQINITSTDGTDTRTLTIAKPKSIAVAKTKIDNIVAAHNGIANAAISAVGKGGVVHYTRETIKFTPPVA